MPITRMRADLMNEGYALGLCAAEATKTGTGDFRAIDVKKVQRQLVKKGNLAKEVLDWTSDPEVTDAELKAAAESLGDHMRGSSLIMRCPERALPFLREAFRKADKPEAKQATALMLGILGDSTGAKRLADSLEGKVKRFRLRKGDAYGGEGMDRIGLPLALGRTKAPCALRPLLTLSITEPLEKVRLKKQNACAANISSRDKAAAYLNVALSPNRELHKAPCFGSRAARLCKAAWK